MKPKIREQNPDMQKEDILEKLWEMWNKLSEEEKIPYYVKYAIEKEARNVFYEEKKPVLIENNCSNHEIIIYSDIVWDTLTEKERKLYIDKATMLFTSEQVSKCLPEKWIVPNEIFWEEKVLHNDWKRGILWNTLPYKEKEKYREKASENIKWMIPLACKKFNEAKAKIKKEQEKEKLKNELFEHMEEIKQKEQVIKEREERLNEKEKQLKEKEASLIKMEEYLNNLFLL